jgi:hypothetical protein
VLENRFGSLTLKIALGLILAFIAACNASPTAIPSVASPESCQVSDLATVFANPLANDGKMFCGHAVLISERYVAFYPRVPQSEDERYGTVLLPKGNATQVAALVRIGTHKSIHIRGTLEVERDCLRGKSLCTPIRRPIALTHFSFELAD